MDMVAAVLRFAPGEKPDRKARPPVRLRELNGQRRSDTTADIRLYEVPRLLLQLRPHHRREQRFEAAGPQVRNRRGDGTPPLHENQGRRTGPPPPERPRLRQYLHVHRHQDPPLHDLRRPPRRLPRIPRQAPLRLLRLPEMGAEASGGSRLHSVAEGVRLWVAELLGY